MKKIAGILAATIFLLVLTVAGLGVAYRPELRIPEGLPGHHVDVAGVKLRVERMGNQGAPILLIHGSPGSLDDWHDIAADLALFHRVVTYDRPGQGYSAPSTQQTVESNARVAAALLDELEWENAVVVGHSMGGATALALATMFPQRVSGLVIVSSRGYSYVETDPVFKLLAVPVIGTGFAALAGATVGPSLVEKGLRAKFHPNEDQIAPGFVDERVRIWTQPKVLVASALERASYRDLDRISRNYPKIQIPVMLVYGDSDSAANIESGHRLAQVIPSAEVHWLPKTGHMLPQVRGGELTQLIKRLVRRVVDESKATTR